MDSGENIFEITNYKGDPVVFSKKKWLEKKGDHRIGFGKYRVVG